jgi:Nif-specific regulatory protein
MGFYDHDFLFSEKAHVSLCLRPGCECIIRKITLRVGPSKPYSPAEYLVVRLNQADLGNYCLLNRFYSFSLNSAHPDVAGYFLQDITALQDKMRHLTRQYEEQLKRSEELNTLLSAYKQEQDGFIGASPEMAGIREKAAVVADSGATVLIQGPTGTGKEVLARYIHEKSPFRKGPFVKVDCSTLPRELMESELFGHEKGAFTGAVDRKIGRMEQADKGTLFLDEVGNLTPEAQAKLLQFLQDLTISRVGGQKSIRLDLRVIAASNLNLEDLVKRGTFREDLFYRLYVVAIYLPPLKERREDIPALCDHFLRMFSSAAGKNIARLSSAAFKKVYDYEWPGNIRELKNAIQRAVLFCELGEITEDLIQTGPPGSAVPAGNARFSEKPVNARQDREYHFFREITGGNLMALLSKHRGNVLKMARELGVTSRALYYQFKRNNIDPGQYRLK